MPLDFGDWRVLEAIHDYPDKADLKENHKSIIALLDAGMLDEEAVALGEDREIGSELTEKGKVAVRRLKEMMAPLLAGVPLEERTVAKSIPDFWKARPLWFSAIIKKKPKRYAYVSQDRACVLLGRISSSVSTIALSDGDSSVLRDRVKLVETAQKTRQIVPYAFQMEAIDGMELIAFRTEKGDYAVLLQAIYVDYLTHAYKALKWHVIEGKPEGPLFATASPGVVALLQPVKTDTEWRAPVIE